MIESPPIAVILIGRNEGDRLRQALASLKEAGGPLIYVDSGSTDGSVPMAEAIGAKVVALDMNRPFTAARARNAGVARLVEIGHDAKGYIQFMDGDCSLQEGWLDMARCFMNAHPDVAAVCGRRRERFPEASIFNRLIDYEWATPVGETQACGGDVLMRFNAFQAVGGYNPALIAGEEPDLCFRMRQVGWRIWRLDAEMTLHDAEMTRLGQWWQRCKRAGYAFAEGMAMHGTTPERYNVAQTRRALIWGAALPLTVFFGLMLTPWALLLAGLWGLKILKLRLGGYDWARSVFLTFGNLPEAQGVLSYYLTRLTGRKRRLIEYK